MYSVPVYWMKIYIPTRGIVKVTHFWTTSTEAEQKREREGSNFEFGIEREGTRK